MNDFGKRIAGLSPEKRSLLELRLAKAGKTKTEEKSIRRRPLSSRCPLSFAQQRLWFIQQMDPDAPVYNMSRVFRIQGNLNIHAFQQSVDALIRRHETLRTVIRFADGRPAAEFLDKWSFVLRLKDLMSIPKETRETESRRLIEAEITAEFVLWNRQTRLGEVFDSSSAFRLPDGAKRSPDVSWVRKERWESPAPEQREKFPPLAPDFVLELRSPTDNLKALQEKMQEYRDNGVRLGWLIDCKNRNAEIWRPGEDTEILQLPETLSGEDVLPGFALDMQLIWGERNK